MAAHRVCNGPRGRYVRAHSDSSLTMVLGTAAWAELLRHSASTVQMTLSWITFAPPLELSRPIF